MSEPISNLSAYIDKRVAQNGFCVVTDHRLREAFPSEEDLKKKAAEIHAFAEQNNLDVSISFLGICATFSPKPKKAKSSSGRISTPRQKNGNGSGK